MQTFITRIPPVSPELAMLMRSLTTTLIARADETRGGDALVWRRGFHADHEQVDDHADFGDC
jgi:hypothetical protein